MTGLRVAIVTPSMLRRGGTEVYIARLLLLHGRMGIATTVFTQDEAPPSPVHGAEVVCVGNAASEALSPGAVLSRGTDMRALANRLHSDFDLVQFHRLAPLDLLQALRGRVRVALFMHTSDLTCPAGGRLLQASGKLCSAAPGWRCLGTHAFERCLSTADGAAFAPQQRLRAVARGPATRTALGLSDGNVFNSHALQALHEETIGEVPRAHVLHPPVHCGRSTATPIPGRLLYAGRLARSKGALDAVRVCALLPGTRLRVVGDGPDRDAMIALARKLDVSSRIEFTGWLEEDALAVEYASAACMLLPARGYEAFSMQGAEAVALGCPVVAFDNGGIGEWLDPGHGTLVPHGDVNAMAAAAQSWTMHLQHDAAAWRRNIDQRFGPEAFADAYRALLAKLTARPA